MARQRDAFRARGALAVGRAAAALSQRLGRGSGSIIGGRVALRLDPAVLGAVAAGRSTALVTGTNGKSTVTALVAGALGAGGTVATNSTGANMPDGIVTALAADGDCRFAALEVDEVYLRPVVAATAPRALVVLNCFREYTRGVSLAATVAHWREVAAGLPPTCTVLANVDDPLVTWAFELAPTVVAVAGGLNWRHDAALCPGCGAAHEWGGDGWSCPGCGRTRPPAAWSVAGGDAGGRWAIAHPGGTTRLRINVLGRSGPIGGAFALAAASALGVDVGHAAEGIETVTDVDGRYVPFPVGDRSARLLMLKNPAGWAEAIDLVASTGLPLVIAVDPFGPKDTTTMWEAPFERLAGREVAVTGGRAPDALAILAAADVSTVEIPGALDAIASREPGDVIVACNYPAFRRLARLLRQVPA